MIISHKHKFIFLKTAKTAGTSIEIALSKICGEMDIITPIFKQDEEIRRELGYRGPQNYKIPFKYYSKLDWLYFLIKGKRKVYFNHMSAKEIKSNVSAEIWNGYYKFSIERNPFDKAISHYYWQGKSDASILDYIKSGLAGTLRGFEIYTINGVLAVDDLFKFEEISNVLVEIQKRLNSEEIVLPNKKAKGNFRKDKRDYWKVISEEEKKLLEIIFAREIALCGYTFYPS